MLAHTVCELLAKARYHTQTREATLLAKASAAFHQVRQKKVAREVDWNKVEKTVRDEYGDVDLWEIEDVSVINAVVEAACNFDPGFSTVEEAFASRNTFVERKDVSAGDEPIGITSDDFDNFQAVINCEN